MKRFLWGVDGVRLAGGSDDEEPWVGGVRDREGSCMVVACVFDGRIGSGDTVGGVC